MKRLALATAIVSIALPLAAAEATSQDAPKPAVQDSPLVAAAKRANRLGKKPAFVITNETLRTMTNAHLTTSSTVPPLPNIPAPRPSADVPKQAAPAAVTPAPAAAAQAKAAAQHEEAAGLYEEEEQAPPPKKP
ncbi:MAG TPA: hypothetical protein VJ276_10900 [Thermoanaerobaculia bacterium]|nr:hypothetical protein [Thermoanaerobaculia bacterium]